MTLCGIQAADLRTLFIDMPDSIMPALTKSERMDFLDYMDSKMKARVKNKLDGESVMTSFSERSLVIMTSKSGRLEMVLFERKDGKELICVIKTVTATYSDSHLAFYNEDWTPVELNSVIELPQLGDYLTKKALRNDSLSIFYKESMLRLQSVTAVDGGLDFSYTSLDYIGESASNYRSWLKSAPLRYNWNGKRFVRKLRR